jgi:hypothetical protein
MGFFKDAAATDVTKVINRKPRPKRGKYVVQLIEVKFLHERSDDKSILVEFEVLESSNPATPVGLICAWYQKLTGKSKDVGPAVYKRFVTVCSGLDPNDPTSNAKVGEAELESAISEEQPLAGLVLDMEAIESTKKDENGDPYVNCQWSNAREPEEETA